jgi:L-2-hydroxycarboxylate dehydrogenase (NAD+)
VIFTAQRLEEFAFGVLVAAGMDANGARAAAQGLVHANMRGVDGHGVVRLIQYVDCLEQGEVNPRPRIEVLFKTGAHALVDAGGGYGYAPTLLASDLAVELAAEHGIALVGVRNSHHFGVAAIYATRVASRGLVALITTNTDSVMAYGAALRPVVGNNPIAIGVPRRPPSAPIVVDLALSQTAFGRIRLAAAEGRSIPLGWALDSDGKPTTDSRAALAANMLLPIGDHKGYALSFATEALAGILTGSPFGNDASAHRHYAGGVGHVVIAIRPDIFIQADAFFDRLEGWMEQVRSTPVADGAPGLMIPGEPELQLQARRAADGIPLSQELAVQLQALATRLGVATLAESPEAG